MSSLPEADKSVAIENALEHPCIVRMDRKHYITICEECKTVRSCSFSTDDTFIPPPSCLHASCNTRDVKVRYSFDYALALKSAAA